MIRRDFTVFLGLSLVLSAATMFAQTTAPAFMPEDLLPGLKPLLETALKQSPAMLEKNLELAAAEGTSTIDRAGLFPSLSANGSYAYSQEAISGNSKSRSTTTGPLYGASFVQPLYQWGALKAQADIGKLMVSISKEQYAETYRTLALSVRSQYLTLIGKKTTLRNQRFSAKLAADLVSLQEAKLGDGRISSGEIVEPRLAFQEAQIAEARALEDYESSRRVFAHLIGIAEVADDKIPSEVPKPAPKADNIASYFSEMRREGPGDTPLMLIYKQTILEDDLNYKIQKVRLLPKFNFTASFSQQNENGLDAQKRPLLTAITITTISAGANWTIFDGFATRGYKRVALAAKRIAERQLKDYSDATEESLRSLEKQIGFSARLLDVAEARLVISQALVERVTSDVKDGTSPQNLLNTVVQSNNTAELTAMTARADFLAHWSEYISLSGVDPAMNNLPVRYLHHVK